MSQFSRILPTAFTSNNKVLSFEKPMVMGILNSTPDSFYDGGKYMNIDLALRRSEEILKQGGQIIDIGAASTRPGAEIISPDEEWIRLEKPFLAIRKEFPDAWISVDTYHSQTAERVLDSGADMINDISAGTVDNKLWNVLENKSAAYVLMHMQGNPQTMQQEPVYQDVLKEIIQFFDVKLNLLFAKGIRNICIDPGFGFGKSLSHNYTLLKNLEVFRQFKLPVMVGLSRKSMVTRLLSIDSKDALIGTTGLHMLALQNGADILRVHDVAEAEQCIRIYMAYHNA